VIVHGKAYDVTEFLPGIENRFINRSLPESSWEMLNFEIQNTPADPTLFSNMLVKMLLKRTSLYTHLILWTNIYHKRNILAPWTFPLSRKNPKRSLPKKLNARSE
jgi:hypothetical protein